MSMPNQVALKTLRSNIKPEYSLEQDRLHLNSFTNSVGSPLSKLKMHPRV